MTSPFPPVTALVVPLALLAIPCALPACEVDYGVSEIPGPVDVPPCAAVGIFGNGATCLGDDGAVDLEACDAGPEAACNPDGLCFDGAALLACTCAVDADCAGFQAYARGGMSAAEGGPIGGMCVAGRCNGSP